MRCPGSDGPSGSSSSSWPHHRRERERAAAELEIVIQQESLRRVLAHTDKATLAHIIDQIACREQDAFTAGQALLGSVGRGLP